MNPELPPNPRAELEAKVTALLLGELSAAEAAALRELINADAELARLEKRISQTLELMRAATAPAAPLKLSSARREKLLANFKTIQPAEFSKARRPGNFLLFVLAAAACLALLVSLFLPAFSKAKLSASGKIPVATMRMAGSYGGGGGGGMVTNSIHAEYKITLPQEKETSPGEKMVPNNTAKFYSDAYDAGESRQTGSLGLNEVPVAKPLPRLEAGKPAGGAGEDLSFGLSPAASDGDQTTQRERKLEAAGIYNFEGKDKTQTKREAAPAAQASFSTATASMPIQYAAASDVTKSLSDLEIAGRKDSSSTRNSLLSPPKVETVSGRLVSTELDRSDIAPVRMAVPVPIPQSEILTASNAFTTFSLNVSDVAFKLAQASLQNEIMPDAASMRSEEFINAFDYRDPEPAPGAPIGFAWERATDPFAHNRDFVRFSIKAAAQGRAGERPLNLVLIVDKSGSMERADRVEIVSQALRVLASQLRPSDTVSVVVFARTARLWVDGAAGSEAGNIAKNLRDLTPEGGTNLEEAMRLAYAAAVRHYLARGENRVVLLTDGAANLGDVEPESLKKNVETNRTQGIALDCFGVGWDGYNDHLLEMLARAGGGRYGFINTPEEAATEFAGKLAGALRVAAADVKVQVEFNPARVTSYRQIGYAKDQLAREDFRDNNVKAAQIGAAEAGNALYTIEVNPGGEGPLGTVHVRFRAPGTSNYEEHEWPLPYTGGAVALDQASAAMRLIVTAAEFSEWLSNSPFAADVTPSRLLQYLRGAPAAYGADTRPAKLEWMIRQASGISGK